MAQGSGRTILMLQGPHGPFFRELARVLQAAGAEVRRVCFNVSDEAEWGGAGPMDRFNEPEHAFEEWLEQRIAAYGVTDIVLYGDSRPVHRTALEVARKTRADHPLPGRGVCPATLGDLRARGQQRQFAADVDQPALDVPRHRYVYETRSRGAGDLGRFAPAPLAFGPLSSALPDPDRTVWAIPRSQDHAADGRGCGLLPA